MAVRRFRWIVLAFGLACGSIAPITAWAQLQVGTPVRAYSLSGSSGSTDATGLSAASAADGCDSGAVRGAALPYACLNRALAPRPTASLGSSGVSPTEGLTTAPPNRVGTARGLRF